MLLMVLKKKVCAVETLILLVVNYVLLLFLFSLKVKHCNNYIINNISDYIIAREYILIEFKDLLHSKNYYQLMFFTTILCL